MNTTNSLWPLPRPVSPAEQVWAYIPAGRIPPADARLAKADDDLSRILREALELVETRERHSSPGRRSDPHRATVHVLVNYEDMTAADRETAEELILRGHPYDVISHVS